MKNNYTLQKITRFTILSFVILLSFNFYSQTLLFEDFEDSTVGYIVRNESAPTNPLTSSNAVEYNLNKPSSTADYFGRVSLAEVNNANPSVIINNIQGTRFFGVFDADQSGNPNGTGFDIQSINWFNIDVSSMSTINASAFFAETDGSGETWDPTSSVRFEYSTNNSSWTPFFAIESGNNIEFNRAPQIDTNLDGLGDGPEITSSLTEYTSSNINVSGINTISIRIIFDGLNSNDEDIALDNFTIKSAAPADTTPPTVTNISVNGSPTTNATSVSYNVTFSENVTGVDTNDFTVDGSGVTGSITNVSGSGSNYIVTVGSVSGTGTLSVDLKASGTSIIDASNNGISGGFTNGAVHTVDTVAPSITNITLNGSPTTNATSVNYNITFDESVIGVTTDDFTVDGSGVTANITNVTGTGSNYVVTVSSVSGSGTLSIDLKATGTGITDVNNNNVNGGFTNGAVHTVDTVAPNLTSSNPTDNATGVLINQDITLTFNENISKGTGNIVIKRTSDSSIFETINVSSTQVLIAFNVATVNPVNNLDLNTAYHIEIDNTVFKDAANNNYSGITSNTTYNFISEANQINSFNPFSGNWSNASNWSLGRLPIATDNIIVDTGKTINLDLATVSVNNITTNISGTLNILSGNALTINGNLTQNGTLNILSNATANGSLIVRGTSAGNVTYLRYVSTNWHLIAAPVENYPLNALVGQVNTNGNRFAIAPYVNNTTSLLRYNYYTDNSGTNDIDDAGNFLTAKGYAIQKSTVAGTISFTGALNVDNAGESIAIKDGGDNPTGSRWNLVGNPYTSAIHGNNASNTTDNFLKTNINTNSLDPTRAGLYLWNGATPYEIKSIDDAAFSIAPGQAFFVHAPDNGGTSVSFTEAMQTHETGDIFLKNTSSYPEIILNLSENKNNVFTKIRYISNKTEGLDIGSDVGTFTGESTNLNIFSHLVDQSTNVDFAIQALPDNNFENMIVPVGVIAESGKEISISIDKNNFPKDLKIYLEDRLLNRFIRLDQDSENYNLITTEKLTGTGRFYLHTTSKNVLSVDEQTTLENIKVYTLNNSTLRIVGFSKKNTLLSLYNILGKKIWSDTFTSDGSKDIQLPTLASGIYIVQIETSKGQLSKKITLQ
ncbi:Ig-like domain-containing protein [uncultured Polaribacter sp.]|uniref:Ig-like domain-containing protein n=1 Tax=uncultured Polaribacter sp. TaxID=174711 RepID=UPI00261B6E2A|nr:Ig-like domain-containing protein [uncultured Polaribacter sp.]